MAEQAIAPLSRGRAWALALVATFTMAISYFDRHTLAVLAPTVTQALHLSDVEYGWLASAFSIAYLVAAPIAGKLIDAVGARRGLLVAVLVWSLVAALHAIVPGFGVLFALRIALGIAESPSFPGATQTVQRALPPAERARGFGILFTGSSIGAMIAPLVATRIEAHFGWRAALLGTALVGLVWVPVWIAVAFAPEARRVIDAPIPVRGFEPGSYRDARSLDVAAEPTALEVVLHPAVLRGLAVVIAAAPSIAFCLLWGAKYLVLHHGLSQAQVGYYLWIPPLFFDFGAIAFGDRSTRREKRSGYDGSPPRALFAVATVFALSFVAAPLVRTPLAATLLCGICLAGGGGLFALLTADMMARIPPSAVSFAGGCSAAAQSLAYIIVNPLIGRGVMHFGNYTLVMVLLGAWTLPGCLVWLLVRPPPPYDAGVHAADS